MNHLAQSTLSIVGNHLEGEILLALQARSLLLYNVVHLLYAQVMLQNCCTMPAPEVGPKAGELFSPNPSWHVVLLHRFLGDFGKLSPVDLLAL